MKATSSLRILCSIGILSLLLVNCKPSATVGELTGVNEKPTLVDTDWEVTSIKGKEVPARSIMISFGSAGNQLSGLLPCNNMGGTYTQSGKHLTVTMIATKKACEGKMELENLFSGVLSTVHSYAIEGRVLTLKAENGDVITLRPYYHKGV